MERWVLCCLTDTLEARTWSDSLLASSGGIDQPLVEIMLIVGARKLRKSSTQRSYGRLRSFRWLQPVSRTHDLVPLEIVIFVTWARNRSSGDQRDALAVNCPSILSKAQRTLPAQPSRLHPKQIFVLNPAFEGGALCKGFGLRMYVSFVFKERKNQMIGPEKVSRGRLAAVFPTTSN